MICALVRGSAREVRRGWQDQKPLIFMYFHEVSWLCTKNPVSTLTHRSIRPFGLILKTFSRPERPILTPKNPMKERLLVQSQVSFGSQHEMWSKQHNGKVSLLRCANGSIALLSKASRASP